jgi:anthranilate/para-aminobenzoate synthase component I
MEKEQAEHLMVVDMCRNDLNQICTPGSVKVSFFMEPLPLPYTIHLYSRVEGTLRKGVGLEEIVSSTFPPPSVTGTPKRSAVEFISRWEKEIRGPYTGTLGVLRPDGEGVFSVLIRTFYKTGSSKILSYGSGGGIVSDSNLQREWEETLLKGNPYAFQKGENPGVPLPIQP